MIGTRLAHYEITSHLGSGGMGDVYQAMDSKLGRSVAVKFLSEALARDADRLVRFEREARVLASLNHPNIAGIYGLEESGGRRFLVMELIPGETLAERIQRGPIPLDDALEIAHQIAAALGAAHEQGIVHRDLKPANIKVTAEGKVKVLDFGLAKASAPDAGSAVFSNSPTMVSMAATNVGMILGTAAYMSPEQARGRKVDHRADIWSFGVVLCEMLTGRSVFAGEDITEILASVVKDRPDLGSIPRRVRPLLEACLEKDAAKRLQSIGDMRLLLRDETPEPVPIRPRGSNKAAWGLAIAALLAAAVAFWAPWRKPPEAPEVVRFQVGAPPRTIFTNWMSLSPDGRKIVFTARDDKGSLKLWIRSIESLEAKPLTTTSGYPVPFWSPDSRWIVYQMEGKLRKVEAAGGPSQVLCDASQGFGGGTITPDGATVLFGSKTAGLMKVPSSGGVVTAVTTLDPKRQETGHYMPLFLPDGKHFLYHRASSNIENDGTFVGSLDDKPDSPTPTRLIAESLNAVYVSSTDSRSGFVLFRRERALMAQPFDLSKLALTGEPVLIADPVGNMAATFLNAMATPKTLILRDVGIAEVRQPTWFDRNNDKRAVSAGPPGAWVDLSLSPDGTQVAAAGGDDGNRNIYTIDLARQLPTRLTFGRATDSAPVWSPDQRRIAFSSDRTGTRDLFWKAANGTTPEEILYQSNEQKTVSDWSRDGKYLIFSSLNSKTKSDLWTLAMSGPDHKATLFLGSNADESQGHFSPDGNFVVYRSDESGTFEVYLRTFPDTGGKWQVSKGGGNFPRWSFDGKQLYYTSGGASVMAVKVTTKPSVVLSDPETVLSSYDGGSYDVGRDGRFLMAVANGQNSVNPITVILNWQNALKHP